VRVKFDPLLRSRFPLIHSQECYHTRCYKSPLTKLGFVTRVVKFGWIAVLLCTHAALSQNSANTVAAGEQGKAIFVSRCAKCHDADARRKLPDGTTLLRRLAEKQDRRAALATRLKNTQERDAVFLYLQPLIDHWHPPQGQHDQPSPAPSQRR